MRIVSFIAIKGGVGKTTLAFNFGEWLACKGKKVLLIDLDHQCNLTQTYQVFDSSGTVANIFLKANKVDIIEVKNNISILPGSMNLDKIESSLESNPNKNMLLYMWLEDHYDSHKIEKYDYIIVDCHPDFSIATKNAIAISHSIISPIIPGDFAYNAKFNLEERLDEFKKETIDFRTRESYVTAKLYFIANMISHNKKSSKELLEILENENNLIGLIPDKELFNRSTLDRISLSEMKNKPEIYRVHKNFLEKLEEIFSGIYDKI